MPWANISGLDIQVKDNFIVINQALCWSTLEKKKFLGETSIFWNSNKFFIKKKESMLWSNQFRNQGLDKVK